MRITGIRVWRVELPLHEGRYSWSNDNFVDVFDSTVVAVDTDAGLIGWGEVCPLGPAYLPAYANGARAGIREIGPALIGLDPRELGARQPGHGPDAQGPPLRQVGARHGLLGPAGQGGGPAGGARCSAAASATTSRSTARSRRRRPTPWRPRSAGYRAEGYRKFQLKVGGEVEADIARIRACAAVLAARRRAGGRRQHRLDDARGGPGLRRGARRRRLHRAALRLLRGLPDHPPPHRQAVRARRDHGRAGDGGARPSPTGPWT